MIEGKRLQHLSCMDTYLPLSPSNYVRRYSPGCVGLLLQFRDVEQNAATNNTTRSSHNRDGCRRSVFLGNRLCLRRTPRRMKQLCSL